MKSYQRLTAGGCLGNMICFQEHQIGVMALPQPIFPLAKIPVSTALALEEYCQTYLSLNNDDRHCQLINQAPEKV